MMPGAVQHLAHRSLNLVGQAVDQCACVVELPDLSALLLGVACVVSGAGPGPAGAPAH